MNMGSATAPTGYGPSARLFFDGDEEKYELWEVKFFAHLRIQKLLDVMTEDPTTTGYADRNAMLFAELVQRLDDKSLSLIMRDAKDDGKKSIKILRDHYLGTSAPRILSLYTELTTLKKSDDETVTDYILRAEKSSAALTTAGEIISDTLLVAMALKGLPTKYSSFAVVVTQKDRSMTFPEFKSALKSFEETEKSRSTDGYKDKIMKIDSSKDIQCFFCKKFGHRKAQCYKMNSNNVSNKSNFNKDSNDKSANKARWCTNCNNASHDTFFCRKNKSKFKVVNDQSSPSDGSNCKSSNNSNHSFAMKVNLCNLHNIKDSNINDRLLVDCGATSHIITNKDAFVNFDNNFKPESHIIELGDGSRTNNIVMGKGDANVFISDQNGIEYNVLLKNTLYIPSFKQNILSVQAAVDQGISFTFDPNKTELVSPQGNTFDIIQYGKLYYVNNVNNYHSVKRSISEWHNILGHCNISDIKNLSNSVKGMALINGNDKFSCDVCIKGKMPQFRNRDPDEKACKILDLVHADLAGPIDPVALHGFKYAINFTDDYSGMMHVYLLKCKNDAVIALEKFIADIAPYGTIKCLRTDNGTEFSCEMFETVLLKNCVKHEYSAPYSPHQNGTAERAWRSIFEMTRCLLLEAELPKTLWAYAVKASVYIRNRCYNNRIKMTPFEAFTSKKPNLGNMQVFGAKCFAYIQDKKKLDDRSEQGIFVGYDTCSPAYLVYFPIKNAIRRVRCVKFPGQTTETDLNWEEDFDLYEFSPKQGENKTNEIEDNNHPRDVENLDENRTKRYPERNRHKPKYLEDYVQCSIDYCYRVADIPKDYKEAVESNESEDWKLAMNEEIEALDKNNTYESTYLPNGKTTVGSKWVYSVKLGPNDEEKYKARLVAKGFNQIEGVDYYETFSPTARITTVRMLMQLAVQNDYIVNQMDVKSAYLNADLDTEIYLDQPDGYIEYDRDGNKLVWKLNKSLYGLKQSGRNWNNLFHSFLDSEQFKQSYADPCCYVKNDSNSILIIIIWVDDIILASNSNALINEFKQSICSRFNMKDLGKLSWFLGIEFAIDNECIKMSQTKCINKMLKRFNMLDSNPKTIPCDPSISNLKSTDSNELTDNKFYREIVGSLIYIMSCTRPDICFAVTKLSQFMHNPTTAHLNAAKNVLKYLKGTATFSLNFTKTNSFELKGFTDSDWGGSDDRRSISGYCFQLNDNGPLICWKSKKQKTVALSSCEAEYIAITAGVQEAKFLKQLLKDMSIECKAPVNIFVDNQGAIALAKNPIHHQRSKHIDIKYHFIRGEIENKNIILNYIPTEENIADIFTKPISKFKLNKFLNIAN